MRSRRRSISEGGKTSKEGDDNAAEAKPGRGRGGVVLLRRGGKGQGVRVNYKGLTTISKGNCNDEGSDYGKN